MGGLKAALVLLVAILAVPQKAYCQTDPCLCVEKIADDLRNPVFAIPAGDGSNRVFLGEQIGYIHTVHPDGTREPEPFMDLTAEVFPVKKRHDERGLLGLTVHPQFSTNHKLYVFFSMETTNPDKDHKTRISEFQVSETNPNKVDLSTQRIILEVEQPNRYHNGGQLLFRQEGNKDYLYLFFGDGGGQGDPSGNGQNLNTMLGKVLRLDVDSATLPYGIPPTNPFADGVDGLPEIYAYGVRNMWRCGMAKGVPGTGQGPDKILCGDVGQHAWEEIDEIKNGANYGWNVFEGNACYRNREKICSVVKNTTNYEPPIHSYRRNVGRSVTGGSFYSGCRSPSLNGFYIYGDYANGRLFRLLENQGQWENQRLQMCGKGVCTGTLQNYHHKYILSFGEDEGGEVYMLASSNPIPIKETGTMYRIVDPASASACPQQ